MQLIALFGVVAVIGILPNASPPPPPLANTASVIASTLPRDPALTGPDGSPYGASRDGDRGTASIAPPTSSITSLSAVPSGTIIDNATGGDCTSFGIWNTLTKTCTLTSDTTGTMTIASHGVTLDGAGHTITSPAGEFAPSVDIFGLSAVTVRGVHTLGGGIGIAASQSDHITIEHNTLENLGWSLIYLASSNNSQIRDNTGTSPSATFCIYISGAGGPPSPSAGAYTTVENNQMTGCRTGIFGPYAYQPTIRNNSITDTTYGITLDYVAGATMTGNTLTGTQYSFLFGNLSDGDTGFAVDETNVADGKPLIFQSNRTDEVYEQSSPIAAYVCRNCVRTTLRSADIAHAYTAAVFSGGHDNRIEDSHFSDNGFGAYCDSSPSCTTADSTFMGGVQHLYIERSPSSVIERNLFSDASTYSIRLYGSLAVSLLDNTFTGASGDIALSGSSHSSIQAARNAFTGYARPLIFSGGSYFDSAFSPEEGGGNYYDIYDEPSEGCEDANNDKFCDAPFSFPGGMDSYPWATEGGWEEPKEPRQIEFVHGIRESFDAYQQGQGNFRSLTNALRQSHTVTIFPYYQDAGYSPVVGGCTSQPAPNTDTDPLFAHPESITSDICDSQGALAYNATRLGERIALMDTESTLIGYSMGASTIRGWMTLAQSRNDDTNLSKVDTIVTIQGVQGGSYLANFGSFFIARKDFLTPIFWAVSKLTDWLADVDLNRPAIADLTPRSTWYESVNPTAVPENIHYFNIYSDITLAIHPKIRFVSLPVVEVAAFGDTVTLPGDPDPTALPLFGGARFLPAGKAPDRHEFAVANRHEAELGSDIFFPILAALKSGLSAVGAAADIVNDPRGHTKLYDYVNDAAVLIDSCKLGVGQTTVQDEILRILADPAVACDM